jgi:homoserine kinase type II
MAAYTEIEFSKAQQILNLYGNYTLEGLTPLSLGISNSNYRVQVKDAPDLVLKISNDKGLIELRGEQNILLKLKENGFEDSLTPLLTRAGEPVYELPPFHGVIYPFVQGEVPQISETTCFELGQALAKLHLASQKGTAGIRDHRDVGFDAFDIIEYIQKPQCPQDFKAVFHEIFPDSLEGYLKCNFPRGIIHGDLYYDNVLMYQGKLKTILDFEQGGIGSFLFDLGVSISGSALQNKSIDFNLMNIQIQGYESIRNLNQEEKMFLSTAVKLGLFSIGLWRIKRFNEKKLDLTKIDNYKELIERALKFDKEEKNDKSL